MVQKLRFKCSLGVHLLEDRLQPNDMFGLGLSLLTGASPTGMSEPTLALNIPPAQQAVALIAEATPATTPDVPFELPRLDQTTHVVTAPVFDASILDNVFGTVNAQPNEFSLTTPVRHQTPQAPVAVDVVHAQPVGGVAVVAPGVGTRGHGGSAWTPTPLPGPRVNESLVQAISFGLNKEQQPPTRDHFVTITDQGTSVNLNAYGFANSFTAGGGNQLYNTSYFLSTTGGAPVEISADDCSITYDLFQVAPNSYHSMVQCGNTYLYFIQEVYGQYNLWMTAMFAFGPISCAYAYNDYDVGNFENNNGSYQNPGGGLTRMVVRDGTTAPKYLFADYSDPVQSHYAQAAYPELILQITGFTNCGNLGDGPALFGPDDWTGAFQYSYPPATELALIINFHYRADGNPFP